MIFRGFTKAGFMYLISFFFLHKAFFDSIFLSAHYYLDYIFRLKLEKGPNFFSRLMTSNASNDHLSPEFTYRFLNVNSMIRTS